jgi:transcriptional regulator with XRE-family HTH domain
MPLPEPVHLQLLRQIGSTIRSTRRARGWSQRRLAAEAGISQAMICAIERLRIPDLPVATAAQVLKALDVTIELIMTPPRVLATATRDDAHARCVAYVARQLERAGFVVMTEVEIGGGRWLGFADVLAYHPMEHVLLVIEVKTEIVDVGEIDRAMGLYERGAWDAARRIGWRPRAVTGMLLVLATRENDVVLAEHRPLFDRSFRRRSKHLNALVREPVEVPRRGDRGLAMIDPRSRRRAWLLPTWLDGRRSEARYANRRDFVRASRRWAA